MSVYLVALKEPDAGSWQKLRDKWPDKVQVFSSHVALVAPSEATLTSEIGAIVGMSVEDGVLGIVVEMMPAGYFGYGPTSLWEWVRKAT